MSESQDAIDEMNNTYAEWMDKYKTLEFIDDWDSEEGKAKLSAAGENRIFTNHSTCTEDMIVTGMNDYTGSCCWSVYGYWITENPWKEENEVMFNSSVSVSCLSCNPEEEEDKEGDPDCDDCGGSGTARYYAD
jgi:hypothetical protein